MNDNANQQRRQRQRRQKFPYRDHFIGGVIGLLISLALTPVLLWLLATYWRWGYDKYVYWSKAPLISRLVSCSFAHLDSKDLSALPETAAMQRYSVNLKFDPNKGEVKTDALAFSNESGISVYPANTIALPREDNGQHILLRAHVLNGTKPQLQIVADESIFKPKAAYEGEESCPVRIQFFEELN